nr:tetraacyldisaccharide 4'-kinase [Lysobacter silvestris]
MWADAVESLYRSVSARRRRVQQKRAKPVGVPVLVIGNLIAGGAGKTPLTIAVVERLRAWGWNPGVASRGYGRRDAKQARWVESGDDPAIAGDEPVVIARRTKVPVRVDVRRADAARALRDRGCDIVVCDDGLQHYALARDIEIEVIDGVRGYGNERMIPAGPLREPIERAELCDFRVRNLGSDAVETDDNDFGVWPMHLVAHRAAALRGPRVRSLAEFAGQRVHAVAGIGHPERFFDTLRAYGIAVVPHAFPDHHAYTPGDFDFSSPLPVLMTEKDAVKCSAFAGEQWYSVPVDAELPAAFWVALEDRLNALRQMSLLG